MIDPTAVRSLTDFQRNAKTHLKRLKKTGQPEVLTVNGRAAVVVQDAKAYKSMLQREREQAEIEAVRESLRDLDQGKGRPLSEFIAEFRSRRGRARRRTA